MVGATKLPVHMDFSLYQTLNGFAFHHDGWEDVARFLESIAPLFFVLLLGALFLARGKWRSRNARHGVVAAALSAGLALTLAKVISDAVARPRPFVAHPESAHLFIKHAADYGFPSDHAAGAFAIAVALLLRHRPAGLLALAMAVAISIGRVMVGVHYPSDVLAGAVLGTICALFFWHPRVRGPLSTLADRLGELYDRIMLALLRPARV
jgi:undecaprenyl-diphosphatase